MLVLPVHMHAALHARAILVEGVHDEVRSVHPHSFFIPPPNVEAVVGVSNVADGLPTSPAPDSATREY